MLRFEIFVFFFSLKFLVLSILVLLQQLRLVFVVATFDVFLSGFLVFFIQLPLVVLSVDRGSVVVLNVLLLPYDPNFAKFAVESSLAFSSATLKLIVHYLSVC